MPEADQATGREPQEPAIEVDLGEPDPNKAVTRTAAPNPAVTARDERKDADDKDDEDGWLERSRKVQRRIGRMQRGFDQKLADAEARHQRELTQLREDMERKLSVRDERPGAADDAEHERRIAELQQQLEAAAEKGDSAAQARITTQITRAEAAYQAKKAAAAGAATTDARARADTRTDTTDQRPPQQPRTQQQTQQGPTAAGSRFINANEDWWEDDEYAVERSAANTLFIKMRDEEGFDPKDDDTFAEVARRLKKKFPNLPVQAGKKKRPVESDEDSDDEELLRERRPPVINHQDRGAPQLRQASNRRTLSAEEQATMRATGMDPSNNRHVVQFLREAQMMDAPR